MIPPARPRRTATVRRRDDSIETETGRPRADARLVLPLAVVVLSLVYAVGLSGYTQSPFWRSLLWASVTIVLATLLGTGIWFLTGLVKWPLRLRPGFVLIHLAGATVYAWVWMTLDLTVTALLKGRDVLGMVVQLQFFGLDWALGALIYGLMLGVCYTVRVHRDYRRQHLEAARANALAARAQTNALRAQLNPHFLFNALHSLGPLVRQDSVAAEEALERLGELLRYALDENTTGDVTLAEELAFVQNYLALERLRLGARLKIELTIDPAAMEQYLPSFALQPLVENAVRHGLAPLPGGGTLRIQVQVSGLELLIVVEDNGKGAARAAVLEASGLGIRSLRDRLAVRYGDRANLHFQTSPEKGFSVHLRIPRELESLGQRRDADREWGEANDPVGQPAI
jgi:Histidine kinase